MNDSQIKEFVHHYNQDLYKYITTKIAVADVRKIYSHFRNTRTIHKDLFLPRYGISVGEFMFFTLPRLNGEEAPDKATISSMQQATTQTTTTLLPVNIVLPPSTQTVMAAAAPAAPPIHLHSGTGNMIEEKIIQQRKLQQQLSARGQKLVRLY